MLLAINQSTTDALEVYIARGKKIDIPASGSVDLLADFTRREIADSDISFHLNEGNIILNDGDKDLGLLIALRKVWDAPPPDECRDPSGKLRVHQTSRKVGLRIGWSGVSDDPTDVDDVGGGPPNTLAHEVGDPDTQVAYMDCNCILNETWIHEGILVSRNADLDTLTIEAVTRTPDYGVPGIHAMESCAEGLDDATSGGSFTGMVSTRYCIELDATGAPDTFKWSKDYGVTWEATGVEITGAAQTLDDGVSVTFAATTGHTLGDKWGCKAIITNPTVYAVYNGLIIPASMGLGDAVDIITDLTLPTLSGCRKFGGLVYMPDSDLGAAPVAYWDADWNATTKVFDNITPAVDGSGRYNIFGAEVSIGKWFNKLPLIGSDSNTFESSDTEQVGHGIRFKMTINTNTDVADHAWSVACIACMHRERFV